MIIDKNIVTNKKINENITILNSSDVLLSGITNGNIIVSEKSVCKLHGIHTGNIIIEKHCLCEIVGVFNGNITNYGKTDIFGIIKSSNITGTNIFIHSESIVNEKRYDSDVLL
jgi:hypothetical protein